MVSSSLLNSSVSVSPTFIVIFCLLPSCSHSGYFLFFFRFYVLVFFHFFSCSASPVLPTLGCPRGELPQPSQASMGSSPRHRWVPLLRFFFH